ncbi:MAG: TetR/AcrR family transcriptional regulator [Deltaproteobacteria bacterium]
MEVRAQILEEATRLIAARGFEGTSLQAVADAVGVKKPSVLYHFPSKKVLGQAVLDELLSRWNEILPKLLMASALTGLAKFDAVMHELCDFFAKDTDRARLIVRELLDRTGDTKTVMEQQVRPWVDVVASYIEKGQASGQIQADVDPPSYVLHISCLALASFSTSDAFNTALGKRTRGRVHPRAQAELIRIARTSLFEESYLSHQSTKSGEK